MPFSEKIKLLANKKSEFRCCLCHKDSVEVHHIIPQKEGGPDTLDNAAPLCARCHDVYGGNPQKRKMIRQRRDHWWEQMELRAYNISRAMTLQDDDIFIEPDIDFETALLAKGVLIYHTVFEHESFEDASTALFKLVRDTQKECPYVTRSLFLDIEGHRNVDGSFDRDMFELMKEFILGFLMSFLSSVHTPLYAVENPNSQNNDIPEDFFVTPPLQNLSNDDLELFIKKHGDADVFDAGTGEMQKIKKLTGYL